MATEKAVRAGIRAAHASARIAARQTGARRLAELIAIHSLQRPGCSRFQTRSGGMSTSLTRKLRVCFLAVRLTQQDFGRRREELPIIVFLSRWPWLCWTATSRWRNSRRIAGELRRKDTRRKDIRQAWRSADCHAPKRAGSSVEAIFVYGQSVRETVEIPEGDAERPLSGASLSRKVHELRYSRCWSRHGWRFPL